MVFRGLTKNLKNSRILIQNELHIHNMDLEKTRASFECWNWNKKKTKKVVKNTYGLNVKKRGKSRRRLQWAVKRQIQVCAFKTYTVSFKKQLTFTHVVSNLSPKQLLLLFKTIRIKHSRPFSRITAEELIVFNFYLVWKPLLSVNQSARIYLEILWYHSKMIKLETVSYSTNSLQNTDQC